MFVLALILAVLLTIILVAIEIPLMAKASLKASLSGPVLLYLGIFSLAHVFATIIAFVVLNKDKLGPDLVPFRPLMAAIAGVFAFRAVLRNTNITLFQKNVLTIESWVDRARDLAVASAIAREAEINEEYLVAAARRMSEYDVQTLNAWISISLEADVKELEGAANKAKADVRYYKALVLASELPRHRLRALLKDRATQPDQSAGGRAFFSGGGRPGVVVVLLFSSVIAILAIVISWVVGPSEPTGCRLTALDYYRHELDENDQWEEYRPAEDGVELFWIGGQVVCDRSAEVHTIRIGDRAFERFFVGFEDQKEVAVWLLEPDEASTLSVPIDIEEWHEWRPILSHAPSFALLDIRGEVITRANPPVISFDSPANEPQLQPLTGRLLDNENDLPLVGVVVQLPEHGIETVTDKMGVFGFELDVQAETLVRVTATRDGYEGLERLTSVGPDQDIWRMQPTRSADSD